MFRLENCCLFVFNKIFNNKKHLIIAHWKLRHSILIDLCGKQNTVWINSYPVTLASYSTEGFILIIVIIIVIIIILF